MISSSIMSTSPSEASEGEGGVDEDEESGNLRLRKRSDRTIFLFVEFSIIEWAGSYLDISNKSDEVLKKRWEKVMKSKVSHTSFVGSYGVD
jgi:hypothetical protein